ncbi:hypothetical protein IMSHALPRED_010539 [Imshaugia aleurites]|uniref:Uncharacterized protein n=1 Tax=Imshaugia aleurites TaxID=172621 RepID=A0A8H3I1P8_9LECA|nr:hypothetical protein IMSHALPRED_010539 [Imshaugia aleurites]
MARAYQEAHIMDNLTSSVKDLQTKTAELAKAKGYHEERIKNLTTANAELQKNYDALEIRMKANEHNTTARILNTHLSLSPLPNKNNIPLTPLHALSTNRPIRSFPKHEKDTKTMAAADVIQCLQDLGVPSLGLSAGEKKARLKGEIGLASEERGGAVPGEGEGAAKKEGAAKALSPADKARTNTENAKKAAEVRRKVLEAKQKKMEAEKGKK